MGDPAPDVATADQPTHGKRTLVIVAIGLAAISLALFAKGVLAERAFTAELHQLLSPRATTERFHVMFYNSPNTQGQNRWLGIPTVQNPNDVWIIQEILFEVKPDFVVETGTYMGGSAVLWAMILREVNPAGRVLTIDIEDYRSEAKRMPIFKERVDFLLGSSTAPEIVAEVKSRVAGHRVVVILDSNHRKEHVLKELLAYADIVPIGSYLIVQDTNINGHPVVLDPNGPAAYYAGHPGPMEAIQEFLPQDKRFIIDVSRERLMLTMNPKGYLQRVRN